MGFDWEYLLGAECEDLARAYEDAIPDDYDAPRYATPYSEPYCFDPYDEDDDPFDEDSEPYDDVSETKNN